MSTVVADVYLSLKPVHLQEKDLNFSCTSVYVKFNQWYLGIVFPFAKVCLSLHIHKHFQESDEILICQENEAHMAY